MYCFLHFSCHNFVITSFSSQDLQAESLKTMKFQFELRFSCEFPTGKSSPQGWPYFHGGQGHTSRADIPMKRCGKKAANVWIMPWLWNQFFVVVVFWAKTARLGMFCRVSWSWIFSPYQSACVCSPLRIDFYQLSHQSTDIGRLTSQVLVGRSVLPKPLNL